jgi:hypothetical protein
MVSSVISGIREELMGRWVRLMSGWATGRRMRGCPRGGGVVQMATWSVVVAVVAVWRWRTRPKTARVNVCGDGGHVFEDGFEVESSHATDGGGFSTGA